MKTIERIRNATNKRLDILLTEVLDELVDKSKIREEIRAAASQWLADNGARISANARELTVNLAIIVVKELTELHREEVRKFIKHAWPSLLKDAVTIALHNEVRTMLREE